MTLKQERHASVRFFPQVICPHLTEAMHLDAFFEQGEAIASENHLGPLKT